MKAFALLLAWVLAAMTGLAPGREHRELAAAIARASFEAAPLFKDDDDRHKTAATLVAVSFRESGFDVHAIGDGGHSFGAFQNHDSSGGSRELLGDALAQARKARAMLGISVRVCPEHPIAWYASGPAGCANARAQRISRDRMAIAMQLFTRATP